MRATWTYDGFQKLRIKAATSPAATTHFVWDMFGHIIAEKTGTLTREYIWLGDTPLAMIDGATLSYIHPDHLDRPIAMTASGGPAVAWSARYDPFGNVVSITNPTAMPLRFAGQYFQIEDGLSYNWHRNYDPTLGRYSQADPLGFVDGPGVYNYAGQSALMLADPEGLKSITIPGTGGMSLPIPSGGAAVGLGGPIAMCIRVLIEVFEPTQVAPGTCPCTAPANVGPTQPLLSVPPKADNDNIPTFNPPIIRPDQSKWKPEVRQPEPSPPTPPEEPWWVRLLGGIGDALNGEGNPFKK